MSLSSGHEQLTRSTTDFDGDQVFRLRSFCPESDPISVYVSSDSGSYLECLVYQLTVVAGVCWHWSDLVMMMKVEAR